MREKRRLVKPKIIIFFSLIPLSVAGLFGVLSLLPQDSTTVSAQSIDSQLVVSVDSVLELALSTCDSLDNSRVVVNIEPSTAGTFKSNCQSASVFTNSPGYTLSAKSATTTMNYQNPTTISPTPTIASTSNLLLTPSTLTNDTWGFAVENRLGFQSSYTKNNDSDTYAALPTTNTTIYQTDQFPLPETEHIFFYAARLTPSTTAGSYATTITYTAIPAYIPKPPLPYNISPEFGNTNGQDVITINGVYLDNLVSIKLGDSGINQSGIVGDPGTITETNLVDCTGIQSSSPTTASCTTGALLTGGYQDIVITNTDGTYVLVDAFYTTKQVSDTNTIVTTNQAVSGDYPPNATASIPATVSINGTYVQDGTPGLNDPKEIKVIEGDASGNIILRLTGKNLMPWPPRQMDYTSNGITWAANQNGSVYANGTSSAISNFYIGSSTSYFGPFPAGIYKLSSGTTGDTSSTYHVASPAEALDKLTALDGILSYGDAITYNEPFYLRGTYLRVVSGQTVDTTFFPQLETGTTVTEYSPPLGYTDTTINLQGNFLGALPNGVADTIDIDANGNIVLTKRVGKIVYDGSADETWVRVPTVSGEPYYRFYTNTGDYNLQTTGNSQIAQNILNDRLPVVSATDTYNETEGLSSKNYDSDTGPGFIIYTPQQTATVSGFRTWLTQYPVTTYYQLATPYTVNLGKINPITLPEATSNIWATTTPATTVTVNYTSEQ